MVSIQRFVLIAMLLATYGQAYAATKVPTHCKLGEYSIVNAWMGKTIETNGGSENSRKGKFVSLCADKLEQPFGKVIYRYGGLGHVDMKAVATRSSPFSIFYNPGAPHVGEDIVFFRRGQYTYYISIATAMGSGVFLRVYRNGVQIFSRFSGNFQGHDYTIGPAVIDFENNTSNKSGVLIFRSPPDVF